MLIVFLACSGKTRFYLPESKPPLLLLLSKGIERNSAGIFFSLFLALSSKVEAFGA